MLFYPKSGLGKEWSRFETMNTMNLKPNLEQLSWELAWKDESALWIHLNHLFRGVGVRNGKTKYVSCSLKIRCLKLHYFVWFHFGYSLQSPQWHKKSTNAHLCYFWQRRGLNKPISSDREEEKNSSGVPYYFRHKKRTDLSYFLLQRNNWFLMGGPYYFRHNKRND